MVFNSFIFWLIFPVIFLVYWLIPIRYNNLKKLWLLVVSYLLYLNWKPAYVIVLLGVTLVTFGGGYFLNNKIDFNKRKRLLVWLLALIGLLPLLVFKYYNFINESVQYGLSYIGLQFTLPGLNWAIPVGISFYTFQAVGYMLDVYHRRINAERNLIDYMLFVSFFPQVLSGPISKGSELIPQLKQAQIFNYKKSVLGLQYLLWGMFLKLVVADRLGIYVDTVYVNYHYYSGATCFLASIFYSFQIYADFAGYSLMAVGIAKLFGYDIIKNFRQPYFSISITDFWRRWHISLSRWLKDYVYIPLGGSRCSKIKCYSNILITFLVSGVWHGANWTFVLWGFLHGLFQVIEKWMGFNKQGKTLLIIPRVIITFLIVNLLWILFRVDSLNQFVDLLHKFLNPSHGDVLNETVSFNLRNILIVLVVDLLCEIGILRKLLYRSVLIRWSIYIGLFTSILLFGVLDSGQFIYVSF